MPSSYTLGEHFETFVRQMVESGRYASESEVMRDSLRLMEEREQSREAKLEALRGSIKEGLASGPLAVMDMGRIRNAARMRRRGGPAVEASSGRSSDDHKPKTT